MGNQPDLFPAYGTEPHKLVRKEDPETSHEAAEKVDTTKLEALVHRYIAMYRQNGCIGADLVRAHPDMPYSSITARFKALEEKGFISCGPDKRPGPSGRNQRVMRSIREPGT
jgi:hypothetical protein